MELNAYLAATAPTVKTRTLADLIVFDKTEEHERLHADERFGKAEATDGLQDPEYMQLVEYIKRKAGLTWAKALSQYGVNALVILTRGPAPLIEPDGATAARAKTLAVRARPPPAKSPRSRAIQTSPVPIGMVDDLPVGVSFLGSPWSDQNLLSYAYAYEQASHARVPPEAYKRGHSHPQ